MSLHQSFILSHYFYPRPPRGGRLSSSSQINAPRNFYPRPPRGGRRVLPSAALINCNFYPRPPRGGRRLGAPAQTKSPDDFYPRPPRGGRQPILCYSFAECQFLPTPSARRATGVTVVDYRGAVKFLPTPSARRATFLYRLSQRDLRISTHALREEGDLCQWGVRGSVHHFYPRPPRGGRRTSPNASKMGDYFYPRPPRGGRLGCNGSPGA